MFTPPKTPDSSSWPERKKWQVVLVACYVTFLVGINSTSITSAAEEIGQAFDVVDTTIANSYWPVTAWNGGAAVTPMVVIPLLENYGVRPGYMACYVLFTLFLIPQAVAQNFATLIVTRFFAGSFAGVLQDIMDGIISDLWPELIDRSLPVTVYVFALLEGVAFGPVYGGAIISHLDWRWIFYIHLIITVCSFPIIVALFDEPRPQHPPTTHATEPDDANPPQPSLQTILISAVTRPTYLLFTSPVVFSFTLLSALSYSLVFISTQSIPQVYSTLYAWPPYQTSLIQSATCIGIALGFPLTQLQNTIHRRLSRTHPNSAPESRLYLSIPASFLGLAGGLFWYGWTSTATLNWALPSAGLVLVGTGSMVTMQAIMMYVTDCYGEFAASASAAVCCGENLFAALLPLAALPMYTVLGFRWASSLLGFVAVGLGFVPVALVWKGKVIRERSRVIMRVVGEGNGDGS